MLQGKELMHHGVGGFYILHYADGRQAVAKVIIAPLCPTAIYGNPLSLVALPLDHNDGPFHRLINGF